MKFPCEFSIKIMGQTNADLELKVVPILKKYVIDIERVRISTKASSEGKYQSITATFIADSQEQLDNIYQEVTDLPNVIMVL